mgnify:CR=1 FL=1
MSGVKIDRVIEGSLAHQCGFRCGDVVLEVGSNAVTHPIQIFHELAKNKPNGFAEVKVMRDGQALIHNMRF